MNNYKLWLSSIVGLSAQQIQDMSPETLRWHFEGRRRKVERAHFYGGIIIGVVICATWYLLFGG